MIMGMKTYAPASGSWEPEAFFVGKDGSEAGWYGWGDGTNFVVGDWNSGLPLVRLIHALRITLANYTALLFREQS